jgi:hypothetical protein
MRAACPVHLILLDLITLQIFSEAHKLLTPPLCILPHPSAISSHLPPNVHLNLCTSLIVRNQASHSYRTKLLLLLLLNCFCMSSTDKIVTARKMMLVCCYWRFYPSGFSGVSTV